jgi:hypothetical protein
MRKGFLKKAGIFSLFLFLQMTFAAGFAAVAHAGETDVLVDKLVEKGVLSRAEGDELLKKSKEAEQGTEKATAAAPEAKNEDLEKIAKALKGVKIGGLWYLSYGYGKTGSTTGSKQFNNFNVKRGYLTVEKEILPWFSGRITTDITTVNLSSHLSDSSENVSLNLNGSLAVRIKYLYGLFKAPDIVFLTKPNAEVGVVHTPWLDFEEHINYYRMQDTMFIERNGITASADYGVTLASLLGGLVDENYRKDVNSAYPGRYGSVQVGIYNGGGYATGEQNRNKVLEGRITIRPLPDIVPGLQLSYFGVTGKGNTSTEPDWKANLGFASFEHEYIVVTGQYFWGKGNASGSDENDKRGYSVFTELKPIKKVSLIGRFDHFDPHKNVSNDTSGENNRYIGGIAYHIDKQHNNMILLDYDTVEYKQPGKTHDERVQLTWQIAF